jgi:hypothetical protein
MNVELGRPLPSSKLAEHSSEGSWKSMQEACGKTNGIKDQRHARLPQRLPFTPHVTRLNSTLALKMRHLRPILKTRAA